MRKIAQLEEILIFTCNPIKNKDTSHVLPKDIYNPNQDRKTWVIKSCCFLAFIIMEHFCKMTLFAYTKFWLKNLCWISFYLAKLKYFTNLRLI